MKMKMPRLSFSTLPSTPDSQGYKYWLSIDARSSKKKEKTVEYLALAHSSVKCSERDKNIMSVTFLHKRMNNEESEIFARDRLYLNVLLRNEADRFNQNMKYMKEVKKQTDDSYCSDTIQFQDVQMAQICSCKHKEGEFCVFSDKLSRCKMFLKSENIRSDSHNCLDAFVHHFFSRTRGRKALDDLCGVHSNNEGYTLKTPTVHSLPFHPFTRLSGPNDRGEEGIRQVIQSHMCNENCQHLPSMESLLREALVDELREHSLPEE